MVLSFTYQDIKDFSLVIIDLHLNTFMDSQKFI